MNLPRTFHDLHRRARLGLAGEPGLADVVMSSPAIPESSAARSVRMVGARGGVVSIVKLSVGLGWLTLPATSMATTSTVWSPSPSGLPTIAVNDPLAEAVAEARIAPVEALSTSTAMPARAKSRDPGAGGRSSSSPPTDPSRRRRTGSGTKELAVVL